LYWLDNSELELERLPPLKLNASDKAALPEPPGMGGPEYLASVYRMIEAGKEIPELLRMTLTRVNAWRRSAEAARRVCG
jgi:hypothetical protein